MSGRLETTMPSLPTGGCRGGTTDNFNALQNEAAQRHASRSPLHSRGS